jgi:hypothetical protein
MGIDRGAAPSFDEVVAVREERQRLVGDWLAGASVDDLGRAVAPRDDPSWPPPGTRRVVDSLHVVFDEEWWHRRYAVRDLTVLENPAASAPGDSVA